MNSIALEKIIGVDEAGRGPLAGPVVAAAVILKQTIEGLNDSKKLSEKKRIILAQQIKTQALYYQVGLATVEEIDTLNIHQATLLAMQRAILPIAQYAHLAIVDGCFAPQVPMNTQTLIQGDLHHPSISAASIIAKVTRDEMMYHYHEQYPQYHFAQHKGYGTALHLQALNEYGACRIHRKSFAPVRARLF